MEFSLPNNKGVKQEHTDYPAYGDQSFQASASNSNEFEGVKPRKGVRKSTKEGGNTWTVETSAPFDDGYQWRKYGTKEIRRSNYPRSYFRCTYRDDRNCAATKQVQQKDFTDPPIYEVTYKNSHSCNSTPTIIDTKPTVNCSSGPKRPNSISFDFSTGPMYTDEHFDSATNRFDTNQDLDSNFQVHEPINEFTSDGCRIFDDSYGADVYREFSSDYYNSSLQGLSELDGFGDFDLGEYVNSTDINSD